MRSTFRVLKKLSIGALSQQLALRLIDCSIPKSSRAAPGNRSLVYWVNSTHRRNTS